MDVCVWLECARVVPVAEPLGVMVGATAAGEDETEKDETEDDDNLDTGKPELEFTKEFNAKVVNQHDGDEENGDKDTRVNRFRLHPVFDDECCGSQIVRGHDNVLNDALALARRQFLKSSSHLEPVSPAERETQRRVNEAMRITSETRGKRQPRCHLTQSRHNHIHENADGSVGDQKRTWTGICECLSPVT